MKRLAFAFLVVLFVCAKLAFEAGWFSSAPVEDEERYDYKTFLSMEQAQAKEYYDLYQTYPRAYEDQSMFQHDVAGRMLKDMPRVWAKFEEQKKTHSLAWRLYRNEWDTTCASHWRAHCHRRDQVEALLLLLDRLREAERRVLNGYGAFLTQIALHPEYFEYMHPPQKSMRQGSSFYALAGATAETNRLNLELNDLRAEARRARQQYRDALNTMMDNPKDTDAPPAWQ